MADAPLTLGGCPSCGSRSCVAMQCSRVDAETLADQLQRMVKRATHSPPVAAPPATPVAPPNLGAAPQNGWDAWTHAAQPQPQPAQPLTGAGHSNVVLALRDALSVLGSINAGAAHQVTVGGETVFWQRKEWVDWARLEVKPMVKTALDILTAPSTPTPPEVAP